MIRSADGDVRVQVKAGAGEGVNMGNKLVY